MHSSEHIAYISGEKQEVLVGNNGGDEKWMGRCQTHLGSKADGMGFPDGSVKFNPRVFIPSSEKVMVLPLTEIGKLWVEVGMMRPSPLDKLM